MGRRIDHDIAEAVVPRIPLPVGCCQLHRQLLTQSRKHPRSLTQTLHAHHDSNRPQAESGRAPQARGATSRITPRSEEHTSELQSLMRISYAVFCLKKTKIIIKINLTYTHRHKV